MSANSTSWKKGQSGNPGGRAKSTVKVTIDGVEQEVAITDYARAHAGTAIDTLVEIAKDESKPTAARVSAANAILDRAFGKPPQTIIGDPEQPVGIAGVTLEQVLAARAQVVDEC